MRDSGQPDPVSKGQALSSPLWGVMPSVTADTAGEIQAIITMFSAQVQALLAHDRLSVYLLTQDGRALERFAVASPPPIPSEINLQPLEKVGIARVIRTNTPLVTADFGTDERIQGEADSVIAQAGFHGMVSVPLRLGGAPFGLLNFVSRTPGFYRQEDIVIAQQIGDQIAVFMYDLRLQREIRERLARDAAQQERNRLAEELHDTLAQTLSRIAVKTDVLADRLARSGGDEHDDAAGLAAMAREGLEGLRHLIFHATPAELVSGSLDLALRRAAEDFGSDAGVVPSLEVHGDVRAILPEVQGVVLRVAQEALANVRRHAEATNVAVTLRVGAAELSLEIRDDGHGFDSASKVGFGLRTMRARAESVGGQLAVISAPGGPTTVHLLAPVDSGSSDVPMTESPALTLAETPPSGHITRVLVVDDHPLYREALVGVVSREHDLRVVGEAGTAHDAISLNSLVQPDVVLLDLELPDRRGEEIVSELRDRPNPPEVLIVSAFTEGTYVASALAAGARGYLAKSAQAGILVESIRAAVRGATMFTAATWQELVDSAPQLTARELEVLTLLAAGQTNAEIAALTHVAAKTVERIVATVADKLGARNRTHAVARALASRLLDPRPLLRD